MTKKAVLIIEDDEYIRDLYESVLSEAGHEVDTAVDGQEGLVKLQKKAYDLTLLDVMMPNLDGIGFLHKLTEKGEKLPCKVVLLTNLSHDKVIDEALKLGAITYLTKSDLTPDQFVEKVEKYL